ncbi:MAG: tRNA uridine-5-carboxymethylaminomethyl(34) synthesis GTPase MnmE [Pseudomonadota bacterium]|nr:tRNA uridine-5-carboxymethylaminomethyl(34) synthesis GTPase MnmE [Pseudomonadota bacterium]
MTGTNDTIYALSSGAGRAGVAVIRLSGSRAGDALETLAGTLPPPRRASLRRLRHPLSREELDRALVLWFPGPGSVTGEDVVELHVHGGRAVIAGLLDALGGMEGLRLAEAGEFARRAFENGRIDLTQVEGLADLIDAETAAQRRQALRQSAGSARGRFEDWRERLLRAQALVEAALDFSDEPDVPANVASEASGIATIVCNEIGAVLATGAGAERLREGFRVVLAGAPNAGKSSLLNALAGCDAAIVSTEAGTTRDVIEVHLELRGWPAVVMDTAGIRAARGGVEAEGIRRTLARAADADLVLWIIDLTAPEWVPDLRLSGGHAQVLLVANKSDLASPAPPPGVNLWLTLSASTGAGLAALESGLADRAATFLEGAEEAVVTRSRHRQELSACRAALKRFGAGSWQDLELRAEDLRMASRALGRITGASDVEDILDRLFAEFCIGK